MNNYDYIEKQGVANALPFYVGVGKTMKALQFSILVDMYNDVPYTSAFNVTGNVQPTYDKGADIYADLIKQLDSAYDYFKLGETYYETAPDVTKTTDDAYDIVFGSSRTGNTDHTVRMQMWEKLANTIKLRLLLNESNAVPADFIKSELAKNDAGFLGSGESATVNPGYLASTGKISPFYAIFYSLSATTPTANYYRANTYATDFYNNTGDLRLWAFYGVTYPGTVGSNYDGDPASVSNSSTAGINGSGLTKGFTMDQLIMPDFESLFLQAEAAQRGWLPGADPKSLYESAVTQNYVYLYEGRNPYEGSGDPTPVDDAGYYLDGALLAELTPDFLQLVNWDAATDKLKLILTQKWAALNGIDWVDAYDDYRRTGFPESDILNISHSNTHLKPQIPVRYLYPQSEYNTNAGNIPSLGSNYQFSANVFWDK